MGNNFFVDEDRFTHRFFTRVIDLFWLGILTCVCCIPIITIGASFSSLFYCCSKIAKKEDYSLTKQFFGAFKSNFKNGVFLTVAMVVIYEFVYTSYLLLSSPEMFLGEGAVVSDWIKGLLIIVCVYLMLVSVHFWPLQATFENRVSQIFKNSCIISVMNLPWTILVFVLYAFPFVISFFFPELIPIMIMFGFSVPYRISVNIYRCVFKKMTGEPVLDETVIESDDIEE